VPCFWRTARLQVQRARPRKFRRTRASWSSQGQTHFRSRSTRRSRRPRGLPCTVLLAHRVPPCSRRSQSAPPCAAARGLACSRSRTRFSRHFAQGKRWHPSFLPQQQQYRRQPRLLLRQQQQYRRQPRPLPHCPRRPRWRRNRLLRRPPWQRNPRLCKRRFRTQVARWQHLVLPTP
jgi:hypothetical protein